LRRRTRQRGLLQRQRDKCAEADHDHRARELAPDFPSRGLLNAIRFSS
jgi:hypothetical protein